MATADAEALTLTQRVIHEPAMATDAAALQRFDLAGLRGQIGFEELRERPLADEADAGAVLLVEHRQRQFASHASHVALLQSADWKQRARERFARHRVQ